MGETREALVRQHMPLVEHIVLRVSASFPRHVDRSDLVAAGLLGLVEAANRFDPERGVPFHRYAGTRIRGAVLDAVRSLDWVPRSTRQLARSADEAVQRLAAHEGVAPTDAAIAAEMGVSEDDLRTMRERLHRGVIAALDESGPSDGAPALAELLADRTSPGAEERLEQRELAGYLRAALAELPERHRLVVVGIYLEGRTFDEVAELLGVTPSRVSQLRSDALDMIRDGIVAQFRPKVEAKPHGRVAIRQARYASAIAEHDTWRGRIDLRDPAEAIA
ncbi:MAG TPA: FliA/WhiG family RNA polymerase sigma factor [Acidimicrobiales bacterium]|nr:FliA/WhiG family RNA polymerase sigma factor [Acidimicrobiales bacterium]